ncbi:MAG: carbon starvation CstA family protein [Verrucomicrobiota bacterium JB022]|nr:carbon starvation CstA family protein [Verrucomicrobiota bacterium JB022]
MTWLLLLSAVLFALAYRWYGRFLNRRFGLQNERRTPAHDQQDGVDFVPTRTSVVFGHHFSSVAGAGPIVGPILAGLYFGWGPAWMWVVFGSIFVGGVHDYGAAFISVRNKGKTIAECAKTLIGPQTGRLFLLFVLLALIYVIIVFLDLTAATFQATPAVATASGWFIAVAVAFGWVLRRSKLPFWAQLLIFVPLTWLGLALGQWFPADLFNQRGTWVALLLGYCFVAAILPVNVLLQPRDFLSATFLYGLVILGVGGTLLSFGQPVHLEVFRGWESETAGPLMPVLFITVACGACSGFHSIIASGTTARQLNEEADVRRVGYGAMLVEGMLAVFAIATLAILGPEQLAATGQNAVSIFAVGASQFMNKLGVPVTWGTTFASLAVTTFLLTTLDTCTRLGRFLLEELLGQRSRATRWLGTVAVLAGPAALAFTTIDGQPVWKAIWPVFGATNQLLAALALVTVLVYLKRRQIRYGFVIVPALVMTVMPLLSLYLTWRDQGTFSLMGGISLGMIVLGVIVVTMAVRTIIRPEPNAARPEASLSPTQG